METNQKPWKTMKLPWKAMETEWKWWFFVTDKQTDTHHNIYITNNFVITIIAITKPFPSSLGSTSSTSLPNLSLRPIRFASSESPSPPKWTKTYYDLIMIDDLMICWENRQSQNIFHILGIQLTFVCLWFHMFCKVKNEIGERSPSMSTFRLCCKKRRGWNYWWGYTG